MGKRMSIECNDEREAAATRIFISYRHTEPDQMLATQIYEGLRQRYEVFIDQRIPVGTNWARRIHEEIERADFMVVLLSEQSVLSEMVIGELEIARDLASDRGIGRPRILPVRVAFDGRLPYPLSAYFRLTQWVSWSTPTDTARVVERLIQSIDHVDEQGQAIELAGSTCADKRVNGQLGPAGVALPLGWPAPKGALSLDSRYYIERLADTRALNLISQPGQTISIRGPRQIGKTSLLYRIVDAARKQDRRVAWVDFQLFEKSALADARTFYQQFCAQISDALGLDPQIDAHWNDSYGHAYCCDRYMKQYVLPHSGPLVLAMDEVDRVLESRFHSEFFSMLRSWHDNRARSEMLRQLDLVMVASTEPHLWISNPNRSPFAVAERIQLGDFSKDNVRDLNRRYKSPLRDDQLDRLMALVGGHPYLVHYAIYAIVSGSYAAEQLFEQALSDDGPFADHLNHLLFRLHGKPELTQGLRSIIATRKCRDEEIYYRLNGAGLVHRAEQRGRVLPSRQLYAEFFSSRLKSKPAWWPLSR
jgi:hypothetical protein